jgi:hypothetical protein
MKFQNSVNKIKRSLHLLKKLALRAVRRRRPFVLIERSKWMTGGNKTTCIGIWKGEQLS